MKRTSAQLKQMARGALSGHYGTPIGVTAIFAIIRFALSMTCTMLFGNYMVINSMTGRISFQTNLLIYYFIFYTVISLILSIISAGLCRFYLNVCRKREYKVSDMFYAFTHHPDRVIVSAFLLFLLSFIPIIPSLLSLIWLAGNPTNLMAVVVVLLLSAAGSVMAIIIMLQYGLVYYLLMDHTDMGGIEALKESARLMKGNKGRLFYIQLSFIGLTLLSVLTCGIAGLWLAPYMNTTMTYLYLEIRGELDPSQASDENHMDEFCNQPNSVF